LETPLVENDRLEASRELVVEEFEKEVLILDLDGDLCFGLNRVGQLVWAGIERGRTLGEIVDEIADRVDVPRDTVATDVLAFASRLLARNLVRKA
jgi:hypothetical protein